MDVVDLRRREAMQLKVGILRVQRAQKIFIPLDSEIRMKPALHQDAGSAKGNRLINLRADLVERPHISVGSARPAIESAERADDIADIRVVDVAIDDVGDDVVGMLALPNFIGGSANRGYVMRLKQGRALICRHAPAVKHFFQNRFDICRHVHSLLLLRANSPNQDVVSFLSGWS